MWYAIGYEEVLGHNGLPIDKHTGVWRIIAGPHTNPRAASLALGKALVGARGAAPGLHAAYTTCALVPEDDLTLYGLHEDMQRLTQGTYTEVME